MIRAIPKGVRLAVSFLCLWLCLGLGALGVARAQGADPAPIPADVEETIARALYDRGIELYREARYAEAHQLFSEAVARSPQGAIAPAARKMMARAELKMKTGGGPDDTRGTVDEPVDATETIDPYGPDQPIDPYGSAETGTVDHGLVVDDARDIDLAGLRLRLESERSRRNLLIYGGAFGLWHGIALAGATDSGDGGVVLALGGAALGMGGTYFLTRERTIREGQSMAVMSGATWGSLGGLFLGWATSDLRDDTSPEYDGYGVGSLIGGAIGLGAGILWAASDPSAGDVAIVNSMAGYGTVGGLLAGGLMDPPYDGAYGMNAFIGVTAGVGAGLLVANELDVSRARMAMIDLGAAVGALAPWIIVYPILKGGGDGETNGADDDTDVQITSGVSLAGMVAGAILAWSFTRDYDERRARRADAGVLLAPPALLVRGERGGWHLGSPALRLDRDGPHRSVGVGLLGGTF
jgi:hypothetical protein